jgi:hypothetical protein
LCLGLDLHQPADTLYDELVKREDVKLAKLKADFGWTPADPPAPEFSLNGSASKIATSWLETK